MQQKSSWDNKQVVSNRIPSGHNKFSGFTRAFKSSRFLSNSYLEIDLSEVIGVPSQDSMQLLQVILVLL